MSDKYFVGSDVFSSSNNGKYKPVSRITLKVDDSKVITSGDDTGFELIADCPHATQDIADSLLLALKGIEYQTFSADGVNINPSAELGDGVTVRGIYSVLSMMRDDGSGYPSVEAPGKAEDEDEYPAGGPMTREFERQLASTRTLISKTSEEIRLEVANEIEGLSAAIELDMTQIVGRVEDTEEGLSQTVRLAKDGLTITNASGSKLEIDGGQLKANSIETAAFKAKSITADKLNITGAITFGDLDENTQLAISEAYEMAEANQLPSYIKNTYIDSVSIQSPTIVAGTFIGNEFNAIAEDVGGGSFNLYGKYSNRSVHAFGIAYSGGITPSVTIDAPAGGNVYWDVAATYVGGDIDMGMNDIYYNGSNGFIASLLELDARVAALEAK